MNTSTEVVDRSNREVILPSGKTLNWVEIRLLRELHEHEFIRWSDTPFTLKSGIESHVYVFGREDLTDNPQLGLLFGGVLAGTISELRRETTKQSIVIGIPTAGTGLASACSFASCSMDLKSPIGYRIMRENKKAHGAHSGMWVNGRPSTAHEYFSVENVVTSGRSLEDNIRRMNEDGYPVMHMQHLVGVDRQHGGVERLRRKGYSLHVLFTLTDLAHAYVELGLWPEEAKDRVLAEIKAH